MAIKSKQEQLSIGIALASEKHVKQYDKGGKPYILHPLHPLHLMSQLLYDTQLATIAVLHDVVEDSDVSFDALQEMGFSNRVVEVLRLLTHEKSDTYQEYIEKICSNLDAITVKRKDLQHNSCITRLKGVKPNDLHRMEKYHRAFLKLEEAKQSFNRR